MDKKNKVKLLNRFVSLGIMTVCGFTSPNVFAEEYPFASLPLSIDSSLTTKTTNNDARVKPNIMFLIDDTSSMGNPVPGFSGPRINYVRSALKNLMDKHGDKMNIFMLDLCGTSGQVPTVGSPISSNEFLNLLDNKLTPMCGSEVTDHSAEGFYDAIYFMRKNMNEAKNIYRCQANAIVFFSDGEMNFTHVKTDQNGVAEAQMPIALASGIDQDKRNRFTKRYISYKGWRTVPYDEPWTWYQKAYDWAKETYGKGRWWDCASRGYERYFAYRHGEAFGPNNAHNYFCRYEDNPDWKYYAKFEPNQDYSDPLVIPSPFNHAFDTTFLGEGSLGRPSDYILNHDLVTYPRLAGQTQNDAAGKSWDSKDFPKQSIQTYAVGFGVSPGGVYLDGASASAKGHKAFRATNPNDLTEAFNNIIERIIKQSVLTIPPSYTPASPAILGQGVVKAGIGVFFNQGMINSALRILMYKSNDKGEGSFSETGPEPNFEASHRLFASWSEPKKDYAGRVSVANNSSAFEFSDPQQLDDVIETLNRVGGNYSPKAYFGFTDSGDNTVELKEMLAPWLVRLSVDKKIWDKYGSYRPYDAQFPMGDVVDSPVVPGGAFVDGYQKYLITSANDGMSYVFKRSEKGFDGLYDLGYRFIPLQMDRTSDNDRVASHLYKIAQSDYGQLKNPHVWLNNGGITVRTVVLKPKGPQQTFMVATPGQGARGVYGLNVGGKDAFTGSQPIGVDDPKLTAAKTLIFQTPVGKANDLGYVMGNPGIGRLAICRQDNKPNAILPDSSMQGCKGTLSGAEGTDYGVFYAAIYGNGFSSPNSLSKSALEVRQIFTEDFGKKSDGKAQYGKKGQLIAEVTTSDNRDVGVRNGDKVGLSMPALVDVDLDGVVDIAYASTYNGKLYRFDLRGNTPNDWYASKIFETQTVPYQVLKNGSVVTDGSVRQPVMVEPSVYRYVKDGKVRFMITFGTGSNLYSNDRYDRSMQSVYSIEDHPEEDLSPKTLEASDLFERTLSVNLKNGKHRIVSSEQYPKDKHGWYANLNAIDQNGQPAGERVVSSSIVLYGTTFFNTVMYIEDNQVISGKDKDNDPCKITTNETAATTTGWLLSFDPRTGEAPDKNESEDSSSSSVPTPKATIGGLNAKNHEMGVQYDNGATGLSLSSGVIKDGNELATNREGQLRSGIDTWDNLPSLFKNCVYGDASKRTRLIGQDKKGIHDKLGVTLPVCPTNELPMIRLNFRELKM